MYLISSNQEERNETGCEFRKKLFQNLKNQVSILAKIDS